MTNEEANNIIKLVASCYPRFLEPKHEYDDPKIKVKALKLKLLDRDYTKALRKVEDYIENSPYEPKISDIVPYKSKSKEDWEEKLRMDGANIDD